MTRVRRFLCFAFVLLVFSAAPAFGQDKPPTDKKPEPKPRGTLYPGWKQLGLSPEQIERIYKIQTDQRAKIDELEDQIKKLKKEERTRAEAVLTPAQKQRLKEIQSNDTTDPPKDKPGEKDKAPAKDGVVPPRDKPK